MTAFHSNKGTRKEVAGNITLVGISQLMEATTAVEGRTFRVAS